MAEKVARGKQMSLCNADDSQLVVVDIQERLVAAIPETVVDAMSRTCQLLLDAAAILGVPVVRSEQYPQGLGETIAPIKNHLPVACRKIEKTCFSCAKDADFQKAIAANGRTQIVLIGIESHVCILQTAMDLARPGKEVFVVEDAICANSEFKHRNAIERMRSSDIVITNAESLIFEWLRNARHVHFKTISTLLKSSSSESLKVHRGQV